MRCRWLTSCSPDAAGCSFWAGAYLFLGTVFYRQVDSLILLLGLFGRRAALVILALIGLCIAAKYLRRRRFIRKLRTERITPQQAREFIESGDPVTVIDLRHPAEVERERLKIVGALVLRPDGLRSRSGEILRDQEIILYCT